VIDARKANAWAERYQPYRRSSRVYYAATLLTRHGLVLMGGNGDIDEAVGNVDRSCDTSVCQAYSISLHLAFVPCILEIFVYYSSYLSVSIQLSLAP
jgi:hypothetical protein